MIKILRFTLVLIGLLSLSACSTFFGKSNLMPPAPLVNFTPSVTVNPLWSVRATKGTSKNYLRLTPAVGRTQVFVDDYAGNVVALNQISGQVQWKINLRKNLTSGIDYSNGKIYLASDSGQVFALSAKDGSVVWQAAVTSEVLATPTVVSGVVLVKSLDGNLTALSANDGQQLWQFNQPVPSLILHESSRPVVAGGYVIAGFANGNLAVVNKSSGKALWSRPIAVASGTTDVERMVDIDMSPVVVHGIVYVATYQGYIAALGLQSGQLIWRHKISSYSGIAADASRLYVSDAQSYLWAFGQSAGAVVWRQTQLTGRNLTGPALMGNYIIVADGYGYVHWMSKQDGHFVARNNVGDDVIVDPVVSGKTAYIYTEDGTLVALRRS